MIERTKAKVFGVPTPMAGLALGIASLGYCWEYTNLLHGFAQIICSLIATILLAILVVKFFFHKRLLIDELSHPIDGSVVPTFAMASMVVSSTIRDFFPILGDTIWVAMVILHIAFLVSFLYHRVKDFEFSHMIPSWFVPPIGIIVADVSFSGNPSLVWIAHSTLIFGLISYAVMLPMMMYRLIFFDEIPDSSKPTLAVLAAPASLSLAGYLNVMQEPSPIIIALLFGIAVLMTMTVYLAFLKLFKLPFSPGYSAFTFPIVISATAMFKLSIWMEEINIPNNLVEQIRFLAMIELTVATAVVFYVSFRYFNFYKPHKVITKKSE